jgi:ER lumen protein retaining receptor
MADSVSWNWFRYGADYLHFGGMCYGLVVVGTTNSVEGFSRKTQILYQTIYVTRYLDLFVESQIMYLVFFKIAFNLITALMLVGFTQFVNTYDARRDSCNILAVAAPTFVAAYVFSRQPTFVERMWTFSEYLETFALVPQYIVCYKSSKLPTPVIFYILAPGGYRVLYVMNWIYKRSQWHGMYTDYTSWISGGVECILFFDFVTRLFRQNPESLAQVQNAVKSSPAGPALSMLGSVVLKTDGALGRMSHTMEMNVVGRRLPYGLSGGDDLLLEGEDRQWHDGDACNGGEKRGLLSKGGELTSDML